MLKQYREAKEEIHPDFAFAVYVGIAGAYESRSEGICLVRTLPRSSIPQLLV